MVANHSTGEKHISKINKIKENLKVTIQTINLSAR